MILLYCYFCVNCFLLGRSWEAISKYNPSFKEFLGTCLLSVFFLLLMLPIQIGGLLYEIIPKFPFYLRKTHVQIRTTCYVWGTGVSGRNGEIIDLSKFEEDKRFVVKRYKYISTINDAVL